MTCSHENQFLTGTADGILCRKCGRLFKSFDEIRQEAGQDPVQEDKAPEEPAAPAAPKRGRKKKGE